MNKKTIAIIAIVTFVAIAITGLFLLLRNKSGEEGGIGGLFGLPIGGEKEVETGPSENGTEGEALGDERNLVQVFQSPVSGFSFASTSLRFIERETGHIFQSKINGKNIERLSNTTILKTFNSFWSQTGEKIILQYIDSETGEVDNYSGKIASSTIQGMFLPAGIEGLAVSPVEEKIFYFIDTGGIKLGIVASFDNKGQKKIFESPFSEFNTSWANKDTITLLTRPSVKVAGYFYTINQKTSEFKKILGNISGLTASLSPDGNNAIFTKSENGKFKTFYFKIKNREQKELGFQTLPEKCAWSKNESEVIFCAVPKLITSADYPDAWYQGIVSFSDDIWKINISSNASEKIIETDIDVESPILSSGEDYLVFKNKNDQTLWSLKIK